MAAGAVLGVMASDLQAHLFASLLNGHTADVSLVVRGAAWEGVYRLHRVVLIQAGFFQSLFQSSGFSETLRRFRDRDEIDVVFDDPNITRAAFEICISRLYGGGPTLHVDPGLIPTLAEPLTPNYPVFTIRTPVPEGHHPASPRLLLSLIATAVYLSLPTVASKALSAILSSVGPSTVIRYLDFACGKGIGAADVDEPEAAVGLESLAQPMSEASIAGTPSGTMTPSSMSDARSFLSSVYEADVRKEDPGRIHDIGNLAFDYGALSQKVGESAACWLARWGADILPLEQQTHIASGLGGVPAPIPLAGRPRRNTDASPNLAPGIPPSQVPKIWSRGGISTAWACALLGSDLLFVRDEKERYDIAKSVFELRRQQGDMTPDEDSSWTKLFSEGIYYSNVTMEDLMAIAADVSSSTAKPYVGLPIVQAAHWDQSVLRHHITSRPPTSSISASTSASPAPREKEIGVMISTAEVVKATSANEIISKILYRVPGDSSSRLGSSIEAETTSMDELFDIGRPTGGASKHGRVPTSETSFFGLAPQRTPSSAVSSEPSDARWSPHQPLRFGVEFWDVGAIGERARLYSQTVWYAGSLYNVYVQVVRKKGVQLGVYLHRQSTVEALPSVSVSRSGAPLAHAGTTRGDRTHARGPSLPITLHNFASTPSIPRPITPARVSSPSSMPRPTLSAMPSTHNVPRPLGMPATAPASAPAQAYRDSRGAVTAYFTIACHSATGAALTRFSSAPDVFAISQSWGWKSSSRTDEYFDTADNGLKPPLPPGTASQPSKVSLRATVVLGVV